MKGTLPKTIRLDNEPDAIRQQFGEVIFRQRLGGSQNKRERPLGRVPVLSIRKECIRISDKIGSTPLNNAAKHKRHASDGILFGDARYGKRDGNDQLQQ